MVVQKRTTEGEIDMKVKVGDKFIDPSVEPVILIFDSIKEKKEFRKNFRGIQLTGLKFSICSNGMGEQEFETK